MIKRISLVRLRADVPRDTCLQLWSGAHADVVRALPGVLEYTVDLAVGGRPPSGWDAIATLRFADAEALHRFREDPEVQARLLATREDFIEAVDVFLVDEHILIPREDRSDR